MTGLKSLHLVSKLKEEICNVLPSGCRTWIGLRQTQDMRNGQVVPEITILPGIDEEDDGEVVDSILSFKTPQLGNFKDVSKKAIYCT